MTTLAETPDPGDLPRVILSPDEFYERAMRVGWRELTIRLVLNPPLPPDYFQCGKEMVLVVDKARPVLDFKK